MRALALISLAAVGAFLACATAPIGTYDKGDDSSSDGDNASGGDSASPSGSPSLTVSIGGTGTGTVTADGLTCTGTTCTGSYATGTKVTLTATAGTGSTFTGWAGACTGTSTCEATVSGPTVVTATFGGGGTSTLAGTWSGTWTHSQTFNGCTFMNGGAMSAVLLPADAGTTVSSAVNAAGWELRQGNGAGCVRVDTKNGTATADLTSATPTTLSGTFPFVIDGAQDLGSQNNPLSLPFTATIAGATMTGQWTCTGCTGTFTLTRK